MSTTDIMTENRPSPKASETMCAAVFRGPGKIQLERRPLPACGPTDAIVRVSLTTICGTDVHIWRGEYPVVAGRIVGHEPVGVSAELGEAVTDYEIGDRVLVGAITPCGSCFFCQGQTSRSARVTTTTGR